MANFEIPVYLFTGFLDSGKTKFIQETMEDKRFNVREPILILACEEGEVEYDLSKFGSKKIYIEYPESQDEINSLTLSEYADKYKAKTIVIEYNGMWNVSDLYESVPDNWLIYQEMMFAEATTILTYNQNMRNLIVDKLQGPDLVVFNRCTDDTDIMALHKLVRGVSRKPQIIYERVDGAIKQDDIEDPLPFDINAEVIEIEDRDFALWYRDLVEEMSKYDGKTVKFKGIVATDKKLPQDSFAIGRHVMTCCEDDIEYKALACVNSPIKDVERREWLVITAKIKMDKHKLYRGKGPVLNIVSAEKCAPPQEEIATFY